MLADVPHLTDLLLGRGHIGGTSWLAGHTGLEVVQLQLRGAEIDLRPFAQLPNLTRLALTGLAGDQDLTAVSGLTKLTSLAIRDVPVPREVLRRLSALTELSMSPPSLWDAEILASLPELAFLSLIESAEPRGGLRRLVNELDQSTVRRLTLWKCPWVSTLEPLTQLPSLTGLDLDNTAVTDLAPLSTLTRLQWLYLGNTEHVLDLGPVGDLPELKDLYIVHPAPGIDLTPFRGKRTQVHLSRAIKLDERPDGVRLKRF